MVSFVFVTALLMAVAMPTVEALDALDVEGNITISWVPTETKTFSYLAIISITNFHLYRPIEGWSLGWTWDSREVVWDMPQTATFKMKVGMPPFKGIRAPTDFIFIAPGARYSCGPAVATPMSTKNWLVKCDAHLSNDSPTCAVRMSSFLHTVVVQPPPCRRYGSSATCTMLVQWHIVSITLENWQVKVTLTNRGNRKEWRNWNLLIEHPLANDLIVQNQKISVYPGAFIIWGQGVLHMESSIEVSLLFSHSIAKHTEKAWAFPKLLAFNGDTCMLPSEVNILTPVVTSSPSLWKKFILFLSIFATSCVAFNCAVKCIDFRRLSVRIAFRGPVKL